MCKGLFLHPAFLISHIYHGWRRRSRQRGEIRMGSPAGPKPEVSQQLEVRSPAFS